jgi:hypothetical protein
VQFYVEVNEVELWMNEKVPQLTSPDLGKDEDSVLVSFVFILLSDTYTSCDSMQKCLFIFLLS